VTCDCRKGARCAGHLVEADLSLPEPRVSGPDVAALRLVLQRIENIAADEEIEYEDACDRIWKLAHAALGESL